MWDLLDCREALMAANSHQSLWSALDLARRTLGADSFSASRLYDHRPSLDSDHLANIPEAALDDWSDVDARVVDPVMQWLRASAQPIYWDRDTYRAAGQDRQWISLSRGGLSQGSGSVLHLPGGQHYVLGFDWADRSTRDDRFRSHAVAAALFLIPLVEYGSRKLTENGTREPHEGPLSARERECLGLVACGKTTWEIGQILGISPHTANKHVESCVRKLGVSNRTHAATTAVRMGLL